MYTAANAVEKSALKLVCTESEDHFNYISLPPDINKHNKHKQKICRCLENSILAR